MSLQCLLLHTIDPAISEYISFLRDCWSIINSLGSIIDSVDCWWSQRVKVPSKVLHVSERDFFFFLKKQ